jgi:predicted transposase YbfD/YdcC
MCGSVGFLDHFSALEDPRQSWRVAYPLPEVPLLLLCATLSGMEDFTEISLWGRERLAFLPRFLPFDRGVPSHDTLNDIVNAIDGETFKTCFSSWVETLKDAEPDIIAIDGKTSRRAHARAKGISPLHMVSAWASRQRLVLGQEATAEKSNEIRAIPLLLQRLELKGALVTIDAIGAQIDIAATVIERGGDYLFALKGNRPELHAEVEAYFADPANTGSCERHETIDGDHGRIERRMCIAAHDVDWLKSDRRLPGERTFPQLAAIVCVRSEIEREGRLQSETRYILSSAQLGAETFASAVRAHWGVENRLHWVLDVVFHDDLARPRTGFGAHNMAIIKHMATNLLRHPKDKHSLKNRRKLACLNDDYLETLIRQTGALT